MDQGELIIKLRSCVVLLRRLGMGDHEVTRQAADCLDECDRLGYDQQPTDVTCPDDEIGENSRGDCI